MSLFCFRAVFISKMKEFVQKNLTDIQTQSKAISMHIGAAEIIQVDI